MSSLLSILAFQVNWSTAWRVRRQLTWRRLFASMRLKRQTPQEPAHQRQIQPVRCRYFTKTSTYRQWHRCYVRLYFFVWLVFPLNKKLSLFYQQFFSSEYNPIFKSSQLSLNCFQFNIKTIFFLFRIRFRRRKSNLWRFAWRSWSTPRSAWSSWRATRPRRNAASVDRRSNCCRASMPSSGPSTFWPTKKFGKVN